LFKLVVKLAIAGLVANAAWQLGSAYVAFYRFKDAVSETVLFSAEKSKAELQLRVIELASQYEIPLDTDAVSVRRDDRNHTIVDGSYTQPVDLLPGYRYPWRFVCHVDVFTEKTPRAEPSGALSPPASSPQPPASSL
jgi:hypothetical protein